MMSLSKADLQRLMGNLKNMSTQEMLEALTLLEEIEKRKRLAMCQNDFLAFIAHIDTTYKFGSHLKRLGNLLMQIEDGAKDRIAVSMPPRFGKSQMISIYYPAWYLGKHPDHKVIMASHTADLAVDMARKVRNLMQSDLYQEIFPNVKIAADAKAAGKWNTSKGGEFFAAGVGGALAGRGAHLAIVDDPLSEQDLKAGNTASLDVVYEWFRAGLRTRLMPGGRLAILHCLAGNTKVSLANGTTKAIRDIRPGDMVIGYDAGNLRPAKVLGWSNQGVDRVYSLTLRSGVIIRGNERHPFLVSANGVEQWVTIRHLKPGMFLVAIKDARDLHITEQNLGCAKSVTTANGGIRKHLAGFPSRLKSILTNVLQTGATKSLSQLLNRVCASVVELKNGITRKTRMHHTDHWGIMGSGAANFALQKGVKNPHTQMVCAGFVVTNPTTTNVRKPGPTTAQRSEVMLTSRCSMGSLVAPTMQCLPNNKGCALSVTNPHTKVTPPKRGKFVGSLLTTVTQRAKSAHSFVTRAISLLKSVTQSRYSKKQLNTLSITLDELVSITPDGEEEVFDIEVEGTENFLANGVVSHNTRWHQRDLIGRLTKDAALNPDADQYEIFEFPAILEYPNPVADPESPTYDAEAPSVLQKSLWPEQWTLESLLRTKASMPAWQWNAQYQQAPTAQEAAIIKRDDIRWWTKEDPPSVDYTVQAWDTALTTKERSDYSVCQTWGVWKNEDGVDNVILLNRVKGKYEFPELKRMALQQYKDWEPDTVIIETKASGQPLVDEMRRSGIYVQEFSPGKGQDKIARVNSISDMFTSGQVWFPETWWASEVVEELVSFPAGEHDDDVDACSLGLLRIRKGGLLRLNSDTNTDDDYVAVRRAYY